MGARPPVHTDKGAQYSAPTFAEVCRRHGIRRSMGRVGSSYGSALVESFFQGLERELLHERRRTSKARTRLEFSAGSLTTTGAVASPRSAT